MKEIKSGREIEFISAWQNFAPEENDDLVIGNNKLMRYLEEEGFFTAPASTKYHGNYEGGLYDHSSKVFERLNKLTIDNNLRWERDESPFIVGMFHDLCKCDQYKKVYDDTVEYVVSGKKLVPADKFHYEYDQNTLLKGHGSKSVIILSQFINLTEEEMLCIRYHMGAYETDEWDEFGKAIEKYPNVLWTHMADMLASKVDGI